MEKYKEDFMKGVPQWIRGNVLNINETFLMFELEYLMTPKFSRSKESRDLATFRKEVLAKMMIVFERWGKDGSESINYEDMFRVEAILKHVDPMRLKELLKVPKFFAKHIAYKRMRQVAISSFHVLKKGWKSFPFAPFPDDRVDEEYRQILQELPLLKRNNKKTAV